jgi:predicted ATP-grasp superfamily ATP-dependent carboligase
MSASSHTRAHRYAPELTAASLHWLEAHGRRVINGARSLSLELSKAAQYAELGRFGVRTPRTVACVGSAAILAALATFDGPVILKPNRAGKGAGVHLFREHDAVAPHLDAAEAPIDGITLVQQYIQPPEAFITRVEFVGQRFLYAVRVDTSEGFELCPADACAVGDAFCPTDGSARAKFEIIAGFSSPLIERYQAMLEANDAHVAACEFVVDADGTPYTYDVNMNVNYNSDAEAVAGVSGMDAIARYLGDELARI